MASNVGSTRASNVGSRKASIVGSTRASNAGSKRVSIVASKKASIVASKKASNAGSKRVSIVAPKGESNAETTKAINVDEADDGGRESESDEDEDMNAFLGCDAVEEMVIKLRRLVKEYEDPYCTDETRELTVSAQDDAVDKRANHHALVASLNHNFRKGCLAKKIARRMSHPVEDQDADAPIRGLDHVHHVMDKLNDGLMYWLGIANDHHYQNTTLSQRVSYSNSPDPEYLREVERMLNDFKSKQKPSPLPTNTTRFSFEEREKTPRHSLMDAVDKFHPEDATAIQTGFVCMLAQDVEVLDLPGDEETGNGALLPATSIIEVTDIERVKGMQYARIVKPMQGWIPCHDEDGRPSLPSAVRAASSKAIISLGTDGTSAATIVVKRLANSGENYNEEENVRIKIE